MKRFLVALLMTVSVARDVWAQCDGQLTGYVDMRGEALYKQSTGEIWFKLYRQLIDEETSCTVGIATQLDACTATQPQMYAWLVFQGPVATGFIPGPYFSGWSGPGAAICSFDWKTRFDPNSNLVTLLRDWAEGSAPSITFYVGRLVGAGPPSTQDFCEPCGTSENYLATFGVVGVPGSPAGHHPFWYTAIHTVTNAPGGCRPECQITPKPQTAVHWGAVKKLYR
jgi:hypothetical protein